MQKIILITIVAYAAASPAYFLDDGHYKSINTHSNQILDYGSTYIHTPIVPVVHEISSKKSTLTKTSQVVNHGGTEVLHTPVYQEYHPVAYSHVPSKTTVTKSNQIVNHGGSTFVHAPLVHSSPVVHATPLIHSDTFVHASPIVHSVYSTSLVHSTPLHSSVYYPSPVVSMKSGDSAISHHSSTVHETVPVVNHLPLYALHH